MEIATRLIMELCGGEPSELAVAGAAPEWQRSYTLHPERVVTLGGVDIPESTSSVASSKRSASRVAREDDGEGRP